MNFLIPLRQSPRLLWLILAQLCVLATAVADPIVFNALNVPVYSFRTIGTTGSVAQRFVTTANGPIMLKGVTANIGSISGSTAPVAKISNNNWTGSISLSPGTAYWVVFSNIGAFGSSYNLNYNNKNSTSSGIWLNHQFFWNGSLFGVDGQWCINITATLPPTVTSATAASGAINSSFSYTTTTDVPATSFSETGTLPSGISLDTSSGIFSGTPTATGTFPVTISATNAIGTTTASLSITISQSLPVISSATSLTGTYSTALTYSVVASNSPTSYGETGTLPTGLSFDTTTGILSGAPTQTGSFPLTLSAINTSGTATASLAVTINRAAATVTLSNLSQTYNGTAKSITVTTNPVNLAARRAKRSISLRSQTTCMAMLLLLYGHSRPPVCPRSYRW